MDGFKLDKTRIDFQLKTIKDHMPNTYAEIQSKARTIGRAAFALVRHAASGRPNCFYAVEAGHVVGTPFDQIKCAEAALLMVRFGSTFLCMWPDEVPAEFREVTPAVAVSDPDADRRPS